MKEQTTAPKRRPVAEAEADGGSWDDVKTAFVEGWATQYNNDIANG